MDAGPSRRHFEVTMHTTATYGTPCARARGPLSFADWFVCHSHVCGARKHVVLRR